MIRDSEPCADRPPRWTSRLSIVLALVFVGDVVLWLATVPWDPVLPRLSSIGFVVGAWRRGRLARCRPRHWTNCVWRARSAMYRHRPRLRRPSEFARIEPNRARPWFPTAA